MQTWNERYTKDSMAHYYRAIANDRNCGYAPLVGISCMVWRSDGQPPYREALLRATRLPEMDIKND